MDDIAMTLRHRSDDLRRHLVGMLPDPDAEIEAARTLTAPRGRADDAGWRVTTLSAITAARQERATEQLTDAVAPGQGPDQSNLERPGAG